jgi:hypothetical protein
MTSHFCSLLGHHERPICVAAQTHPVVAGPWPAAVAVEDSLMAGLLTYLLLHHMGSELPCHVRVMG